MGGNSQGEIDNSPPEPGSVADFVALVSETVGRHFKCCICLSTFNDPVMLPCNHAMCRPCALQALKQKQRCPECLNSIPNLRTAQGRNAWITDMVDSLRNCLNEVGASLTQHAPVPAMYRNARPLSPRELARVRARERASASGRPVPPSPPEPPCCGTTVSGSENASRNGRSDGPERRRLPRSLQPERQPARGAPSRGRGRPRRETHRGRSQSRPPPLRGRRVDSSAPLDTQLPHSDVPLGREQLPQELLVDVVGPVERAVQAAPSSVDLFGVGDLVFVANRTWPGINKYGGVALIKDVLDPPGSRYDVKYMVTQKYDRGVEACYIQPYAFVSDLVGARPRRGSKRASDGRLGEDEGRSSVHSRPRRSAVACSPATPISTGTPLRPSAPGSARGNGIGDLVISGETLGGGIGQHTSAIVGESRLSLGHPVEGLGCSSVSGAGTPSSGERVQADFPRPEGSHTVSDDRATARNPDERPVNPGATQEGMQRQTPVVVLEQHAAAQTETRAVPREQEASARESRDLRIPEQSSLDVGEALGPCAAVAAEVGRSRRRDEGNPIAPSVETPTKRARAETSTMPLPSRQDPQTPPLGVPLAGHESINPSPAERPGTSRAQSVVNAGHRSSTDSTFVSPERTGRAAAIAFSKRKTGTGVADVVTPKKVGVNLVRGETHASVAGAELQQPGTLPPGTYPPQPPQSIAHVLRDSSPRKLCPPATPSQVPRTTPTFKVGDVVSVQSQSSPGVNKEGGVARVVRAGPNETYDVKYLVRQGTDKGVGLELLSRYDVDGSGSGGAPACSGSGDSYNESGTGPLDVSRTAATPGSSGVGGAGGRPAKRLQRSTKGNCAPDLAAGQANAVYLNILLGDTQHPDHDLDSDLGEALDPTEGNPSVRGARKAVAAREETAAAAVTDKVCPREGNASAGGKRKADNRGARRKQDPGKDDALVKAKRATNAGDHDPGGADGGGCDVSVNDLTGKVDAHDASCEDEMPEGRNPCDGGAPGVRMEQTSRSPRIASPLVVQDAGVAPKTETDTAGSRKPLRRPPPIAKHRGQTRSVVLSTSGLTPHMITLAGNLAKSHGWKMEPKYTADVTHVVCRTATRSNRAHIRSAKFLRAVAAGKWVLNEAWLQECKRRGSPVQEEDFEITGDKKSNVPAAPRRSRIAHGEPDRLGLFHDTVFYFRGEFGTESPPRSELEPMLTANGGIVVETLRALLIRSDGPGSGTRERRRRRVVLFQASPSAPERDARALAKELLSVGRPSPALGGSGASRGRGIGVGEVEILRPLWLVDSIGSFRVLAPSDVHRVSLPEVEIPT